MNFGPLKRDLSLYSRAVFPQRRLCGGLLVFVLQVGWGLRADHEHVLRSDGLRNGEVSESSSESSLESEAVTHVTAAKCCCYQPVTWHVYTNPFGQACPLEGDKWWAVSRAEARLRPVPWLQPSTMCTVKLRTSLQQHASKTKPNHVEQGLGKEIQANDDQQDHDQGWDEMARRPLWNLAGDRTTTTTRAWIQGFDLSVLGQERVDPWDEDW